MEIKKALIKDMNFIHDVGGIICFNIMWEYELGGEAQLCIGSINDQIHYEDDVKFIFGLIDKLVYTFGLESKENLKGTPIKVKFLNGNMTYIGNFKKELWFNVKENIPEHAETAYTKNEINQLNETVLTRLNAFKLFTKKINLN